MWGRVVDRIGSGEGGGVSWGCGRLGELERRGSICMVGGGRRRRIGGMLLVSGSGRGERGK